MKLNISQEGTVSTDVTGKANPIETRMPTRKERAMENTLTRSDERNNDSLTPSFTGRVASWSARHRWWVVAASVTMLVLAVLASSTFKVKLLDDNDFLEGESGEAVRLMEERFDGGGAPTEQLVFSHPSLDVSDPVYRSTVERLVQEVLALPEVASAVSYYETGDPRLVSADRRVQRAQVVIADIPGSDDEKIDAILETVYAARAEAAAGGFYVGMAGDLSVLKQVEDIADEDLGRVLIVTLVLALVMLLLVFRTVVAALIPLVLAMGAIIIAMGIAALVSQAYPLGEGYDVLVSMLGLAVGIDYSLFIISRFRYERQAGREKLEAITVASNTTGRAVFYAGVTVVVSLAGMALTDNPVFISLALGVIFVVLVAIVGSLTFLPAVLSVLGDDVNQLRVPLLGRANGNGGLWSAITKRVLARPAIFATVTATALVALAAPVASLEMGFPSGSRALHNSVDAKQAVRLLEEHFSGGLATPALVVVDAPEVTAPEVQASVARLVERVGQDSAFLGPFETVVNPAGDLLFVQVPLTGDREAAERGVELLRDEIIPEAFDGSGAQAYVASITASSMDFTDATYRSMPYVFGFVLGLAFLLLLNRIKEAYDQGHGNDASVSEGIRLTAGQITSAAAIMVGVFGTFALGRTIDSQIFGVGLGVAVLIDATIIRSVLLPATMKLLGDWNWYLPNFLRWLPDLRVEATKPAEATASGD